MHQTSQTQVLQRETTLESRDEAGITLITRSLIDIFFPPEASCSGFNSLRNLNQNKRRNLNQTEVKKRTEAVLIAKYSQNIRDEFVDTCVNCQVVMWNGLFRS
jgi:hypothetical protein